MNKLLIVFLIIMTACTTPAQYESIDINPEAAGKEKVNDSVLKMFVGQELKLSGNIRYSDGKTNTEVIWESAYPQIASVSQDGNIKALAIGETTISVSPLHDRNQKANLTIEVTEPLPPSIDALESATIAETTPPKTDKKSDFYKYYGKINGKVYDSAGYILSQVKIQLKSLDRHLKWETEIFESKDGSFSFAEIPQSTVLELSAQKEGWTTRQQIIILKESSNEQSINQEFNFGGTNPSEKIYALRPGPEISSVTINSRGISYAGTDRTVMDLNEVPIPEEKGNKVGRFPGYINIVLNFDQNVNKQLVEESFQIISQKFASLNNQNLIITHEDPNLSFNWQDENKSVHIRYSPHGDFYQEAGKGVYRLQFQKAIADNSGIFSPDNQIINFKMNTLSSYIIFSFN